jgi:phage protein D
MIGGSYIEVGDYVFRAVHAVTVKSSWKTLGDTCTIQLPNIKELLSKAQAIKGGDRVIVKLGYNEDVHEEFRGYVSHVSSTWPYTIECLDDLYPLTRETVTKAWESTTLKDVLKYLVTDATLTQVPDISLSGFRLNRVTKAAALQKLRDEYGLVAYFREGKLYCGLAYGETGLGEVVYHFEKNLPKAQTGIDFVRAADINLKVKAISMMPDNTTLTVEAGDADGELRTLHYYNKTAAELKVLAEDAVNLLKYDGLRGSIKTKGLPRAKHGQVAELISDVYPERTGNYFIDGVTTTFNGSTGFSRSVELGRLATASLIQSQQA